MTSANTHLSFVLVPDSSFLYTIMRTPSVIFLVGRSSWVRHYLRLTRLAVLVAVAVLSYYIGIGLQEDSCLCSDAKDDHMHQNRHKMSLLECKVGKTVTETGTTPTGTIVNVWFKDLATFLAPTIINSGVQRGVQILAWWWSMHICNATPCACKNLPYQRDHVFEQNYQPWRSRVFRSLIASAGA